MPNNLSKFAVAAMLGLVGLSAALSSSFSSAWPRPIPPVHHHDHPVRCRRPHRRAGAHGRPAHGLKCWASRSSSKMSAAPAE